MTLNVVLTIDNGGGRKEEESRVIAGMQAEDTDGLEQRDSVCGGVVGEESLDSDIF